MRHVKRYALPDTILNALASYQNSLNRDLEPMTVQVERSRRINKVWEQRRRTKAMAGVQEALNAMAPGRERCMYCEDSRASDIEHFRPKARFHQQVFVWSNLLAVCPDCNREKNQLFDERILDPTVDDPLKHLALSPTTGRYQTLTARGAATLETIPRLAESQTLARGRQGAWAIIRVLLQEYDNAGMKGDATEAERIRELIVNAPFSGVFAWTVHASRQPGAAIVLGDDIVDILTRYPAMSSWLVTADEERFERVRKRVDDLGRSVRLRRR